MATLLLADDSVTIQRVIELTFANESIRVVTAPDGHAATAILEAERPDIVLADVGLPAVDGYTLAERLKRNQTTAAIPVLLLTGAFEPIDEARARRTGCNGVLVKPFEPHRVVNLVKALLAGQTPDNLWPNDMPRIDTAGQTPQAPTASRSQAARRESVAEPGTMPTPSAIEEVFEIGLDDLDMAFSRLDPVAPPSRIDADSVSDFQRDIEQLRSVTPEPTWAPAAPPRSMAKDVVSHLPVEDVTPIDVSELDWDLPAAPATRIDAVPLPTSFPVAPPTPSASAPPELLRTSPTPPTPPTPLTPPVVAPDPVPPLTGPTLSAAFSALLSAEQSRPASAKPTITELSSSDAMVEAVVRRVAARLTGEVDRLVREELERLKR